MYFYYALENVGLKFTPTKEDSALTAPEYLFLTMPDKFVFDWEFQKVHVIRGCTGLDRRCSPHGRTS